jgi:hypothetical protein
VVLSALDVLLSTHTGAENAHVAFGQVPGLAGGAGATAPTVAVTATGESCKHGGYAEQNTHDEASYCQ